ncbi:MAG: phosphoglycerate dehydrogenase [Sulfurimonadaceae bacterium]
MKTQDFIVISKLTVGITTVAFSKDEKLLHAIKSLGFKEVLTNRAGERFSKEELVAFLSQCDVAIVGLDKINTEVLSEVPNLKAISKYGVGLDNIDFMACQKYGVEVLHTQGVNKRSVSELTLGYMLSLFRNIYVTSNLLKQGIWKKSGGTQLSEKTVGIIGVGNIGKDLISLLKPFGCRILVNDIIDQDAYYKEHGLISASKEEIYKNADVITIHTPLDESTKNMISKEELSMMKSSVFLINSARSGIINETDLKWALQSGVIAGAALDVYTTEPPQDSELIGLANLITTPHIGGNAQEAIEAMGMAAIENILEWIKSN